MSRPTLSPKTKVFYSNSMKALRSPLWLSRLLLSCLIFGSAEILPWALLEHTSLPDLAVRGIGYLLLTILLLDLAVRYRVRDLFDGMALVAGIGLLAGLLIMPDVTFANFPRTLATRGLGGQTLTCAIGFGLFLLLLQGHPTYRSRALAGLAWTGFYWGTWMRWTPVYGTLFKEPVALGTMFAVIGLWSGAVLLLYALLLRAEAGSPLTSLDFRLGDIPFALLFASLITLLSIQAARGLMDGTALFITLVLIFVCWAILWFRRSDVHASLLESHLPIQPPPIRWFLLAALLFTSTTILASYLPLVGTPDYNQLWLMEIGYAAIGFLWLPALASVIAVRGIDRLMRSRQFEL